MAEATGIVAQAPTTTIDPDLYAQNKSGQLNSIGYLGRTDWTPAEVTKVLSDSGMTPDQHYELYGKNEGISTTEAQQFAPLFPYSADMSSNRNTGLYASTRGNPSTPGSSGTGSGSVANWQQQISNTEMPTNTMRTITPQETVQGQLKSIIDENSPLMQSAKGEALAQSNSRGLINSSLAVQAGQKAVIDTAAPIAAQDASTYAASGLSAQNANQELNQTKYNALLGTVTKAQELSNAMQLATQQGKINSDLQAQQDAATYKLQTTLKQMGIDVDLQNIAQNDRQAFTGSIGNLLQQYQVAYTGIMQQPDQQLSQESKAAAVADLQSMLNANLASMANVYGYQINWGLDTVTNSGLASSQSNTSETFRPMFTDDSGHSIFS